MNLDLNFKKQRFGANWIPCRRNSKFKVPEKNMLLLFKEQKKACDAGI